MTPAALAALHRAAFVTERAWTAQEFSSLLDTPHVHAFTTPHGFALTRTVAGESELLTLAVDPDFRRQGIAAGLLTDWLSTLENHAETAFLEVAADNHAACALYKRFGFAEVARRAGYYARHGKDAADALILRRDLTLGQPPVPPPDPSESG